MKPPAHNLPRVIVPVGLNEERKRYLYSEIKNFCRPGTENLVAPTPYQIRHFCNLCLLDNKGIFPQFEKVFLLSMYLGEQ